MVWNTQGLFHLTLGFSSFLLVLASSIEESQRPRHVKLEVDAHGGPRALMRQEDHSATHDAEEGPQDTMWARFFGTGSASIPDVAASSASATNGTMTENLTMAENLTKLENISKVVLGSMEVNGTNLSSLTDAVLAKLTNTEQDCKDTWEPEWSTLTAEENCENWAKDSGWGALSSASSLQSACLGEWAQVNCMATCGCAEMRNKRIVKAIMTAAQGLRLSSQQMEHLSDTLEQVKPESRESIMHVMAVVASVLRNAWYASHTSTATTTTTEPPILASDILALARELGFNAEQIQQLDLTLQLIDPGHYDDILATLTSIARARPTTSTTAANSDGDIVKAAADLGLAKEDMAVINATLNDVKPEFHDDILEAINESAHLAKQIGVERTGKAIVRHVQNFSKPSRERLPQNDEPNDFSVMVAAPDERQLFRDQHGHDAIGFHFKVSLPIERIVSFIEDRAQVQVEDPRTLSLVITRLEFSWPSQSCSNEESGFTDFKLLNLYAGKMVNEGSDCGALVATSIDKEGEMRLPKTGSQDLFWLAGMFGSKYSDSMGGAQVNVKVAELVFHEFRENGDVIEYSICGRGSLTWKDKHFYLGCPETNPLSIVFPDDALGEAVKICYGSVPSSEKAVQSNCFNV
eukprot:CAMPEP_0181454092 /NCGR_PEP_ID=MMETSP1110-20121109/30059_1 /TAXON_ID=174948 /ORGANISM="Symbiodinium sp., Strain CCMP421" /LENGTH=635 /DNA_ID=CAMNT_0023578425 /DNA_START=62 /DNA_END=1969 /DNA_ORIENTATION=+